MEHTVVEALRLTLQPGVQAFTSDAAMLTELMVVVRAADSFIPLSIQSIHKSTKNYFLFPCIS